MKSNGICLTAGMVLAASASAAVGQTQNSGQNGARINIIHIMTDDHSFQTISAYGGPLSKIFHTPNIDRLAREGMLFTRGYVENSISSPSRAALLTGKYSHINGQKTLGNKGFIPGQPVFPQMLQKAGYQTAIIGKWHLGIDPYGFDYWKILNGQGFYYNPDFKSSESDGKFIREEGYATELITDHALEWLDARDRSKPFCLLLHHKAPHRNWMPGPGYLDLYKDITVPEPSNLFDDYKGKTSAEQTQEMSIEKAMSLSSDLKVDQIDDPKALKDVYLELERMTPAQRRAWDAVYGPRNAAFVKDYESGKYKGADLVRWKYQQYLKDYFRVVTELDDQIGRILDYLDRNGLTKNTLVVYTSDQGFYMGEHGWFDKRWMYEESFRTPIIARLPGVIRPGSVNRDLVQNIDFAPTYLDMAGVAVPDDMAGRSWKELFSGKTPKDWRTVIYYHYYDYPAIHMVRKHDGVATKDYKLIHFYGPGMQKDKGNDIDAWELYDLRKDPHEMNNVYSDPKYAKIVADLKAQLDEQRRINKVTEF